MTKPAELVLIRGLPGSGKTTLAKKFTGYDHHEADHFFEDENGNYRYDRDQLQAAHRQCLKRTTESLWHGRSVVVSNTFTQWWEMVPYLSVASAQGCSISIIVATGKYQNVHNVPSEVIESMAKRWED